MPYKHNEPRRHKIPKARYRVENWREYEVALRDRGSLTVWVTPEAIAAWHPARTGRPTPSAWPQRHSFPGRRHPTVRHATNAPPPPSCVGPNSASVLHRRPRGRLRQLWGSAPAPPRASALHQSSFRNLQLRFIYRSQMSQITVTHPTAYPRQNALAKSLKEIGRLERTLFMLDWISDPALRRRTNAGLNKGEARNALARAVFFHRLGEIRDRTFENQRYRASGLNLAVAAIILWNTVYLGRAVDELRSRGEIGPDELLAHVAPLGWEHIAFNGDYVWPHDALETFRPLRNPRAELLDAA